MLTSRHSPLWSWFVLVVGSITALATIVTVFNFHSLAAAGLPFRDQWEAVDFQQLRNALFDPHNEHTIFFPRLFFMLDVLFAQGKDTINLAGIVLIECGLVAVMVLLLRRANVADATVQRGVIGLLLALFFAPLCWENLLWGFQVQFVGVLLLASGSFAALALVSGWSGVMLALLCALVATFSLASGILAGPVLILMSLAQGRKRAQTAALGIGTMVILYLLLSGYQRQGNHPLPDFRAIKTYWELPQFLLMYLGSPFSRLPDLLFLGGLPMARALSRTLAVIGGVGVVLVLAWGAMHVHRLTARTEGRDARLALIAIILFCLGMAAMTSFGRVSLGVSQAISSRYGSPTLLLWAAVFVLALPLLTTARLQNIWGIAVAVMTLLTLADLPHLRQEAQSLAARKMLGASAMLSGVRDKKVLELLYPDVAKIDQQGIVLFEGKLGPFSAERGDLLGRRAEEVLDLATMPDCAGIVQTIQPIEAHDGGWKGGYRIGGDAVQGALLDHYLVVNGGGVIVGFGNGVWRDPLALGYRPQKPMLQPGWYAYAPASVEEATIFGVLGDKRACRVTRVRMTVMPSRSS